MQAQPTPTRENADRALEKVLALFESGNLPTMVAQTVIHRMESDAPSAAWSLGNQLLMLLAGTTDARGFRQWQAVGRNVLKGAKAFHILAPVTVKGDPVIDPATGVERPTYRCVGFKAVPVFRMEDTNGAPITQADYTPATMPPLLDVAARLGVSVRWAPFLESAYGWYSPSSREITLCTHDVSTFFHELAHAAHGTFRELKGGQHAGQEIVAETVAATLCQLYGFEGYLAKSHEYIRAYAKGTDPAKAAMRLLTDVQRCLDVILQPAATAAPAPAPLGMVAA